MKKIFLVFSEKKDGKHFAHAETISTGENLMNYVHRYPDTVIMHICENATRAAYLAEQWNQAYRNNGEYLYSD